MNKVLLSFLILIQSNYSSNQNFFTQVILKSNSSMVLLSLCIGVPAGLTMTLLIEKDNKKETNKRNFKNEIIQSLSKETRADLKTLKEKGIHLIACEDQCNKEEINLDTSLKNIIKDRLFKNPKLLIFATALLSLNIFGIQFFIKWFLKIK